MNIRLLRVARELRFMYGEVAVINLFCVLRGEINRFVGINGPAITTYCKERGVI